MVAASQDHPKCVSLLLPHEAGLRTSLGLTALMLSSIHSLPDMLYLLLCEAGLQTTERWNDYPSGVTALMLAAREDNVEAVTVLRPFEQGLVDNDGHTALWYAQQYGSDASITILQDETTGMKREDPPQGLPRSLLVAAIVGDCEMAMEFLDEAGHQNSVGVTALMKAARRGYEAIVTALVPKESGMRDENGRTALMYAAEGNHAECLGPLLPQEGGLQATGSWYHEDHRFQVGTTSLMLAVHFGHVECVRLLSSAEARLSDCSGVTALMYAVSRSRHESIALLLAEARLQTREKWYACSSGLTALMLAVIMGDTDAVRTLSHLELGLLNTSGESALFHAVQNNRQEVVPLLASEVVLQASDGRTQLDMLLSLSLQEDRYGIYQQLRECYTSVGEMLELTYLGLKAPTQLGRVSLNRFLLRFKRAIPILTSLVDDRQHPLAASVLDTVVGIVLAEYPIESIPLVLDEVLTFLAEMYPEMVCISCSQRQPDILLLPCHHLVVCEACFELLDGHCPRCRKAVGKHVRLSSVGGLELISSVH
ncbi:Ankyrin repeat protein 2 [Giardia muris]|uniref:Ankyrin repeat protein 2 n=1 Tax=Giardia muris TaxID=5742 RepID=A0A4Z1T1M8_GIAMU|nr:Ankyrin repeat protein 2 [Giardia muris]|eukprot:TNJ26271.1 Ankyrin repeat protein 2 [Giardia muris]